MPATVILREIIDLHLLAWRMAARVCADDDTLEPYSQAPDPVRRAASDWLSSPARCCTRIRI